MSDGLAGECEAPEPISESAPDDERFAVIRRPAADAALGGPARRWANLLLGTLGFRSRRLAGDAAFAGLLSWVALLLGVLVFRWTRVHWWVGSGHLRIAVQLACLAGGLASGLRLGARDERASFVWPPRGTLFERSRRDVAADLAAGWWQLLPLAPLAVLSATTAVILATIGVLRPQDVRGSLFAADLLWAAVLARFVGSVLGRAALAPCAEAITDRGVHLSPLSFVPWERLSHAIADGGMGVIRLYPARRPWLPLHWFACRSPEEFAEIRGLVQAHLPCLQPGQEAPASRAKWVGFVTALSGVCGGLTLALVALLLMPGMVLWALGTSGGILVLVGLVQALPAVLLVWAWLLGDLLHTGVLRLRGVTRKEVVSEGV